MDKEVYNYIQEIKDFKTLSKEEEKILLVKAKKGEKDALLKLFNANLKLVIIVAKLFFKFESSLSKMDLIQEGNLGLLDAIEKYNIKYLEYNNFTSFAYQRIKTFITRAIYNQGYTIRIPIHKHRELQLYEECYNKLLNKFKRIPSIEELANELKMTIENVRELSMLKTKINIESLNKSLYDNDDMDYYSILPDTNEDILDGMVNEEEKEYLRSLIATLTDKRQEIIKLRYGFDDDEPKGYQEVANILNYPDRRYIYEIEKKALKCLKKKIEKNDK